MVYKMIDKKEFLLQSIIKAYIENLEPIGSTQLKTMYDITFSPATIRGYFKKLGDEGYLAQEHVSSGRTPTNEALKEYWQKRLNINLGAIEPNLVNQYAKKIGLSVFIRNKNDDRLLNIINVGENYMILEFDNFTITLKFSSALFRFLNDMVGLSINDLIKVASQVGANELKNEILLSLEKKNMQIFNLREFMKLAINFRFDDLVIKEFLNGGILDRCTDGIYYENLLPTGYMGVCNSCFVEGVESKMLVVGKLSKDYEYFYEKVVA